MTAAEANKIATRLHPYFWNRIAAVHLVGTPGYIAAVQRFAAMEPPTPGECREINMGRVPARFAK